MIEWAKLVKTGKISVDWYRNKEIKNKQSKTSNRKQENEHRND
jgi:DNA primase